ncbi:uncharacterized protein LOC111307589 isoform X2 [Durio zibethinus]|uniref:Uncharacterized protein LOC111307589 isoform X2 n=1 Tax=Durio zibethinus TaxID=66656 RepID=A0A6P6A921_DURZI|nr:uncharacterized protein LOC111307589 isoform X2 [Durio zibethinus]
MASSSRKVGMSKWKEGQRRSPRISALDACKAQQSRRVGGTALASLAQAMSLQVQQSLPQGPASRTRARKIRKLRPLEDVSATSLSPFAQQGSDQQSHEDHPIGSDRPTSQVDNSPKYDDKAASTDQLSSVPPSTKWMPEKRILELILDILQRRDIYEIFAEPVDPKEVEDYYEIIREPMDFGTMRAKLHEGMYMSLQQFEHDVNLIPRNAMHFNSSTTIYFRQARAIHELAIKVFHSLKTAPENFELEFSETKRRTSRRFMSEATAPTNSSSSKLPTNLRPNSKTNISSKSMPCFLRNSSNLRKSIRGIRQHSDAAADFNARDHEMNSGAKSGRRNSFAEVDRRCTYTPSMSLLTENGSIVCTVYSDSKQLIPVNQQDIGYRESLMLFVKDLGPTAQMIAKRKLIGCSVNASNCWTPGSKHLFQQPECQNPNAFRSTQRGLPILDSAFTAESENLFDHLHMGPNISGKNNYKVDTSYAGAGEKAYARNQMLIPNASMEVASSSDERKIPVAFGGDAHSSNAVDVFGLFGCDRLHQDWCCEIQLDSYPSSVGARELNLSAAGIENSGKSSTPIIMVKNNCYSEAPRLESSLAQSQANISDLRPRNNYNLSPSRPQHTMWSSICGETNGSGHNKKSTVLRSGGQHITAKDDVEDSGSVVAVGQELKASQRLGSRFIFDLPFLKKQLDQINLLGKDKIFQQGSGTEDLFLDKANWRRHLARSHHKELRTETYNDSYKQFSLDAEHGNLAPQL